MTCECATIGCIKSFVKKKNSPRSYCDDCLKLIRSNGIFGKRSFNET